MPSDGQPKPTGQSSHSARPYSPVHVPFAQKAHCVAFTEEEKVPGVHSEEKMRPTVGQKCPTGQRVQFAAAASGANDPAGHGSQDVDRS